MPKIAIVAALYRELSPLVAGWKHSQVRAQNRTVQIYEKDDTLVAFGGMGGNCARTAADAVYQYAGREVSLMISAGLAGGLAPELKVGNVFVPDTVVGDSDNNAIELASGLGTLVTVGAVAGLEHKRLFAEKYHAQAVDMEAFAVADVARIYNVPCIVMKSISDEFDFPLPPLGRFVKDSGEFDTLGFVAYTAVRPWTWRSVLRLSTNSDHASLQLCQALDQTLKRYARTRTVTGLIASV